jgi:hypothetical protein
MSAEVDEQHHFDVKTAIETGHGLAPHTGKGSGTRQ